MKIILDIIMSGGLFPLFKRRFFITMSGNIGIRQEDYYGEAESVFGFVIGARTKSNDKIDIEILLPKFPKWKNGEIPERSLRILMSLKIE